MRPDRKLIKTIAGLISNGAPIDTASKCAGVSVEDLRNWIARGVRESRGVFRELSEAVHGSAAGLEHELAGIVLDHARSGDRGCEKSAQWFLERRYPTRWASIGERSAAKDEWATKEQAISWESLTDEQLDKLEELARAAELAADSSDPSESEAKAVH